MMYPFIEMSDGTVVEHSQIMQEKGKTRLYVYFERQTESSYASAKLQLPDYFWMYIDGFSQEEIARFERILEENSRLLPLARRSKKQQAEIA